MAVSAEVLAAAEAAAREIEAAAAENGSSYHAAQTFYGVEAEYLVGEEWYREGHQPDGAEIEAVRLVDCDGERSAACQTVEEIQKAKGDWIQALELFAGESEEVDQ